MHNTVLKSDTHEFETRYTGCFTNMLRWPQVDKLWQLLKSQENKSWYVYTTNKPAPIQTVPHSELTSYIDAVDIQVRQQHKYDYCGIIYVDDPDAPNLIKIYHPKNLGASCGSSSNRPIPGWILSTYLPLDLTISQDQTDSSKWNRFTQVMKFGQT